MNREPAGAGADALRGMTAVLRTADPGEADPVAAEKAHALAIAEELQAFTRRGIIEAAAAITGEPELIQALVEVETFAREVRDELAGADAPPTACAPRCHWCCHQAVTVAAPEVFRIIAHMRTLPAGERRRLEQRLIATDRKTRGRTPAQRKAQREPCGFLHQGRCTIYAVRPIACQRQVSYDANACRRQYEGRPVSVPAEAAQMLVFGAVGVGLVEGLAAAVRPCPPLELVAAVVNALDRDDAHRDWRAGDEVFRDCYWPDQSPECGE